MSKFNGTILWGDVSDSIKAVESKYDILNTKFELLIREFLNYFIEKDCHKLSFDDLRLAYIERFETEGHEFIKTPNNEKEFYQELCSTYFFIVPNDGPGLELVMKRIVKDLKAIETDRVKYLDQLELLKKQEFVEGKNYEERLLIHYIKKQEDAEQQILSYIKSGLEKKANKSKYKSFGGTSFFSNYTYHYNFAPHTYKLDYLSEVSNKLGRVLLPRYFELVKLFRTDKDEFLKQLKIDFNAQDVIDEIQSFIEKNKRLNQRKQLLHDILDLFLVGKTQLFCNVVPQQIEGIIFDYCIERGIDENSLQNSTLGDKINLLSEKGNTEIDYEYFAFKFPIIRNRVAHGKLVDQNLELNSWLLLLDLRYICELMLSKSLKINENINLISRLNEKSTVIELIQIAPIIKEGLDEFYKTSCDKIADLKDELRNKLIFESFPFDKVNAENQNEIISSIRELKKIGINDQECKKILDTLNSA